MDKTKMTTVKIVVEVTAKAPHKIDKDGVFGVIEDQLRSFSYYGFSFTDVKLVDKK